MKKRWKKLATLELPEAYPSANVYMRWHWAAQKKAITKWRWLIWYASQMANRKFPIQAKKRRKVRITRYSQRSIDHANCYLCGDKLILDNLTAMGWLVDDNLEFLELDIRPEKGKPKTVVEIYE